MAHTTRCFRMDAKYIYIYINEKKRKKEKEES